MSEKSSRRWLLPDGVQETLPPDAIAVETLRSRILNIFQSWGYDLVMPAMIEYRDSLLTGTAHDLDTRTFALVDQLSGRQMGVRSDMTPQVARIDAHLLADRGGDQRVSRLCYCGHLLHAVGDGINSSRTPLQIGAEVFGSESVSADIEIVSLMIETLQAVGLESFSIDIGHVGIFRSLIRNAKLTAEQEIRLFEMLQRKSVPDLKCFLEKLKLDERLAEQICELALLNGEVSIIERARKYFQAASEELHDSLDAMLTVVARIQTKYPTVSVHCDLSELRGYSYHTGLVFAAFLPGQGTEVARGGRYDDIGSVFGNARPATGFSADLLNLYQLSSVNSEFRFGILAPDSDASGLAEAVQRLREQGERVVVDLSKGQMGPSDQHCNRQLVETADGWVVQEV